MLHSRRDSFIDQIKKRIQTPGPGSYRMPSDFGIYDNINEGYLHLTNRSNQSFNHTRSQILEARNVEA